MAKLVLVNEAGEVVDSTDSFTVTDWNRARNSSVGAMALLGDMRAMVEEDDGYQDEEED